jgi:hypothetical protein
MIFAALGTVRLNHLVGDEAGLGGLGRGAEGLHLAGAALGGDRLEGGRTHGDHLLGVAALHRLQRVAGVDRTDEGVGVHHLDHVRDLHHVQLGGDAGGEVLPGAGGGREHRLVVRGERHDDVSYRLRDQLVERRALGQQGLAHACDLRRGLGRRPGALAEHEHVDVGGDLLGRRDGLVGGVADGGVVVIGDDEDGHLTALRLRS